MEVLRENIEVPALSSEAFCGKIRGRRSESPCEKGKWGRRRLGYSEDEKAVCALA